MFQLHISSFSITCANMTNLIRFAVRSPSEALIFIGEQVSVERELKIEIDVRRVRCNFFDSRV